jgi:beta-alanine--pyruvate transaminase
MGDPKAFELAGRLAQLAPAGVDHVFFTNSGSEPVDTALKTALAYHQVRGEGSRVRLIGRERGYHGSGIGGVALGGISANRKAFGSLLSGVDHIRHTHDLERNAFSRGVLEHGAEFADDLERLITLHDASTIAAVIIEPVAGSTDVLVPPKGYLVRLRALCDKYGILLIFDEAITGFGRLRTPFAADYFGVTPDLMTVAKGLASGVVPMGAILAKREIYETFMRGPDHLIEFAHGYTYSGHPVACAAALGTLDTYQEEGLLTRASELEEYWGAAVHSMRGLPHVIDTRNVGLIGAIGLEPIPEAPARPAFTAFLRAFESGILIRTAGDTIALSPPLIISRAQIDELFAKLSAVLDTLAESPVS